MKQQPNLKEAMLACLCFTVIGLCNAGLHWEDRTTFVENVTWELQSQLTLSHEQTLKILEINYAFYDAVSSAQKNNAKGHELTEEHIHFLIATKNKEIMNVLNEDQQLKWQKSHFQWLKKEGPN